MSVFLKETTGMDLSEYIGESIYLITGRSNNVIIDGKIFLHDVRAMHFVNGDGSHCEVIMYNDGKHNYPHDKQTAYIYNVSEIVVEMVYGSHKIDYDKE